jgi:hypothetical protein
MSQGMDILKMAPSVPSPDSPPSNDPQFQGFEGETTSIQLRLRGYFCFFIDSSNIIC